MNLEEQYHAEGMPRKIERVEAERDNAWTELREIRAAISANPEESTLDEVVNLRQQLADAQKQIVELHAEVERKMSAASFLIAEHNEQLTAAQKQIVMLREVMFRAWQDGYCLFGPEGPTEEQAAFEKALAANDLKDYILCDAEPAAWVHVTDDGTCVTEGNLLGDGTPLYKARTK